MSDVCLVLGREQNQTIVSSTFSKVALHAQWRRAALAQKRHFLFAKLFLLCLLLQKKAAKRFWYKKLVCLRADAHSAPLRDGYISLIK